MKLTKLSLAKKKTRRYPDKTTDSKIKNLSCVNIAFLIKDAYNLFQNQKSTNSAFYLENTSDNVADFCF
jgi:hypothetical protein